MAQVIIVSNRLPVSVKKTDGKLEFYQSIGGLARGLSSYANNKQNKWIGWPGIPSDNLTDAEKKTISLELLKTNCYPVFLTQRQLDNFYSGYSNTILWPLFHNLKTDFSLHDRFWRAYREVNQMFTDTTLALSKPKSNIWVHDYQLLLVPEQLRRERPRDNIGLFLHIPFPNRKNFAKLSSANKLKRGMLGSDLIGFHTPQYVTQFLDNIEALKGALVSDTNVIVEDRVVRITDFPIGIDYAKFAAGSNSLVVQEHALKLRRKYGTRKIILTVDRLDPIKGLYERLQAFKEFLRTNRQLHGKVILVMLAVPTRAEVKAYQRLKAKVEKLVKEINETFGTKNWQPVDYMYKSLPFEEVSALYQIADVAFITPLLDGMNLVAKEYVASKTNKKGVLILSTTAGAANELKHAILVNPRKRDMLVKALTNALSMPKLELQKRLSAMQTEISKNTIQYWAGSFMDSLQKTTNIALPLTRTLSTTLQTETVINYKRAKKRLMLFDYDGTLADFADHYAKAKPGKHIYDLLDRLSRDPKNDFVIISGRDKTNLDKWLGKLPLTLVAEHGLLIKRPGGKWQKNFQYNNNWRKPILEIMNKYAKIVPGAIFEQKENSLVWHYRKTPFYLIQPNVFILKQLLKNELRGTDYDAYSGNKIIEVKSRAANKGSTIKRWLTKNPDFILAMGDDYTDEDMFEALPAFAYTIKVGRGKTSARYRLPSVNKVIQLLDKLV